MPQVSLIVRFNFTVAIQNFADFTSAVSDRDFYEVLGLPKHAKEGDIKKAFIRVTRMIILDRILQNTNSRYMSSLPSYIIPM
jgi:hypothetical protein